MARDSALDWMWSEACDMLARAERLHREFFRLDRLSAALPVWEPPVDVLETDRDILVLVALPGVDIEKAEAVIDSGSLIIAGTRVLPPFTGLNCRRGVFSAAWRFRPGVTAPFAAPS